MNNKLNRRDAVKALVATGGLFVLGGAGASAPAAPDRNNKLAGEWLNEGREDEPCAIFQQGRVLLVVNEMGDLVTGSMTEGKKFTVKAWGIDGELAEAGKKIAWSNDSTWKRPAP